MFLADPVSDPKTAEQVLMEVLVVLENAPEPEASPGDRAPVVAHSTVISLDLTEDIHVSDLSRETPA